MKILKIIFFVLILAAIIGGAGYAGFVSSKPPKPTPPPAPKTVSVEKCNVEQTVTAPGRLVNTSEEMVKMPVQGKLEKVLVEPGDFVTAGQVLADLDDVAKSQAQVNLLEAKNALEEAEKYRVSLDYPRATDEYLAKLKRQIKMAEENVALMADLYKHTEDPALKAQALASLADAQAQKDELVSKYNWYVGKPTQADKDASDTKLTLLQAKYDAALAALENLAIVAPFDGMILDVYANTGQVFNPEQDLFQITDPKALEVEANITEEDYPLLAPGMEVELYFDARADVTVKGRVERIVPKRIEGSSPLYNIYISLREVPDGLADGMTADAAVTIASRAGVLCLPRAVVRASGEGKAVLKVWNGIETENREVTIGLRGDASVEILSGLKENDQVVTK
jgi:RND family efflux transporter MFP subunit